MANQLRLELEPDSADESGLRTAASRALGIDVARIDQVVVRRKSIDARGRSVKVQFSVDVYADGAELPKVDHQLPLLPTLVGAPKALIIGAGPAGLWAAWRLAQLGIRACVLERGANVRGRRPALAKLNRSGELDLESNYCFGEGGAGTFSDGKLYTRVKKGLVGEVLELLVQCGAPPSILVDSRPHIGTNRLPKVVQALREYLIDAGVEFNFETKVTDFIVQADRVIGVELANGTRILAESTILATGHSARDVYRRLAHIGVHLESKPYALGVRIEHPQSIIDHIQYGRYAGHANLGAAAYSLKQTVDGIGVYSFCMCPGGFVVPATTDDGHVVVNGMSPSKRDSRYANSGMVVTIDESVYGQGPLAGLEYQSSVEQAAFLAGGGAYKAPAQRLTDFLEDRSSSELPDCSYRPGLTPVNLRTVLPERIWQPLERGLKFFGQQRMRGYHHADAVLIGVESRSSAPIRIPRHADSLQSTSHFGLYPCGEGAGYAGGIMSAALDGMKVAEAIATGK